MISPDGAEIAHLLPGMGIQLFDTKSGRLIKTIPLVRIIPQGLFWFPDSNRLAVLHRGFTGNSETITVYSIQDSKVEKTLPDAFAMSFSDDGKTAGIIRRVPQKPLKQIGEPGDMVENGFSSDVILLDTSSWRQKMLIKPEDQVFTALSISPDGKRIATLCGTTNELRSPGLADVHKPAIDIWDRSGRLITDIKMKDPNARLTRNVKFSMDGKRVYSDGDGYVRTWGVDTGIIQHKIAGAISSMSADGKIIIANSSVYNVKTGEKIATLLPTPASITSLAFAPDSKQVIAGDNQSCRLWDIENLSLRRVMNLMNTDGTSRPGYTPAGEIFSYSWERAIYWNSKTGKVIRELWPPLPQAGAQNIHCSIMLISPDGSREIESVSKGNQHTYPVKNTANGKTISSLPLNRNSYLDYAECSQNGRYLSVREGESPSTKITVWDTNNGTKIREFKCNKTIQDTHAYISPDGGYIALVESGQTKSRDYTRIIKVKVSIFPRNSTKPVSHINLNQEVVKLTFSPDNESIAILYENRALIYDTNSLKEKYSLWSQGEQMTSIAFSPDSKRIATGDWAGMLRIWDTLTRKQIGTMVGFMTRNANQIQTSNEWFAYAPDGQCHWSRGAENQVKFRIKDRLYSISKVGIANVIQ